MQTLMLDAAHMRPGPHPDHPEPLPEDAASDATSGAAWLDEAWLVDMEGFDENGPDPWLAERLRLDSETAEVRLQRLDWILDDLPLD